MNATTPLIVLKTLDEVRNWNRSVKSVGFVPTMGALHDGHLDLVRLAKDSYSAVIVSIFVNPSQFAPHEDLSKYPRDVDSDLAKLQGLADAVFLPSVDLLYPKGITLDVSKQVGTFVEVIGMSHQMEGVTRPHFFRGVATVVTKLLNAVQPNGVVFGQKDAQQCAVVKALVSDLCINVDVIIAPIKRESDGLAMSSRNIYLDKEVRVNEALALYQGLKKAENMFLSGTKDRPTLLKAATDTINSYPGASLEYISIAHPKKLEELEIIGTEGAILSGAIKVGVSSVRLIDNILLGCSL